MYSLAPVGGVGCGTGHNWGGHLRTVQGVIWQRRQGVSPTGTNTAPHDQRRRSAEVLCPSNPTLLCVSARGPNKNTWTKWSGRDDGVQFKNTENDAQPDRAQPMPTVSISSARTNDVVWNLFGQVATTMHAQTEVERPRQTSRGPPQMAWPSRYTQGGPETQTVVCAAFRVGDGQWYGDRGRNGYGS